MASDGSQWFKQLEQLFPPLGKPAAQVKGARRQRITKELLFSRTAVVDPVLGVPRVFSDDAAGKDGGVLGQVADTDEFHFDLLLAEGLVFLLLACPFWFSNSFGGIDFRDVY